MTRRKITPPSAYIPPPESKSRDRSWEREQRQAAGFVTVTYRRIPEELRAEIKEIASENLVTVDEIARFFLEYALESYKAGELTIQPKPAPGKYTLFPEAKK
jgi:hypothetical protein